MYNCQNGFLKFGSNCYHLSKETATWQEAFFECKYLAKGSKLVVLAKQVDDHNIQKFLKYRKNGNFLNLLNSYYCILTSVGNTYKYTFIYKTIIC